MTCSGDALERQVAAVRHAQRLAEGGHHFALDHAFERLVGLLGPRIHHLIRRYHLTDMLEDAEQVCAIAVHRALDSYDSKRSSFSTHVTWQLRGELQSLRHRVRLDQRRSAKSAGIRTVALEAQGRTGRDDGAEPMFEIIDNIALDRVEAGASDAMAYAVLDDLMQQLESPGHEQAIVMDQLFDREPSRAGSDFSKEQKRQIVRRTYRNCAKKAALLQDDKSTE